MDSPDSLSHSIPSLPGFLVPGHGTKASGNRHKWRGLTSGSTSYLGRLYNAVIVNSFLRGDSSLLNTLEETH